jgi:hypothetical protein
MKSKVKIIQEAEKIVIVEVAQNASGIQNHIVPGNLKKDNNMAFANQTTKRKFDSKAAVDQQQNENKDDPYNN